MATTARGIRIPEELESQIEREAGDRGLSWSAAAAELLAEAVRMRRSPGPAKGLASLAGGWDGSEELVRELDNSTRVGNRNVPALD